MSKELIVALSAILILTACEDNYLTPPPSHICANRNSVCAKDNFRKITCDNPKKAKFIIDCAKAANPMSDEEGEDLVAQCERTATNLFCEITAAEVGL